MVKWRQISEVGDRVLQGGSIFSVASHLLRLVLPDVTRSSPFSELPRQNNPPSTLLAVVTKMLGAVEDGTLSQASLMK